MSESFIAYPITFDTNWGSRKVIDSLRVCQESVEAFCSYFNQICVLDPNFERDEGKKFLFVAQYHLAIEIGELVKWSKNRTGSWKIWDVEALRGEVKAEQIPLLHNINIRLQRHHGFKLPEDLRNSILGTRIPSATPVELIVSLQIKASAKRDLSFKRRREILGKLCPHCYGAVRTFTK